MPASPEQQARQTIDAQLVAAGWVVQDLVGLNLSAARGVAVREMQSQGGPADYVLFVDGKAIGVLEAKKAGTTLSGVAEQSERYTAAKRWIPQRWADPLPFTYESTGIETNFRDQRDPDSRSRPVSAFHTSGHYVGAAALKEDDVPLIRFKIRCTGSDLNAVTDSSLGA